MFRSTVMDGLLGQPRLASGALGGSVIRQRLRLKTTRRRGLLGNQLEPDGP